MLLKPEPLFAAVESLRGPVTRVILMTPQGKPFKQAVARELAAAEHLLILCGHYEGVDQRVIEALVDEEISIGDYILTNGALAAAVLCDAVIRLLPGALGDERSPVDESFSDPNLLEAPAYTRPIDFRGMAVPEVLVSGHHGKISAWKEAQALARAWLFSVFGITDDAGHVQALCARTFTLGDRVFSITMVNTRAFLPHTPAWRGVQDRNTAAQSSRVFALFRFE